MASPARKRDCPIAGCGRPSRRFSRYCSTHDQRQQRNGHPEQPTVTSKRYRPYIAAAEKCVGMHEEHPTTGAALALAEAFMCLPRPSAGSRRPCRLRGLLPNWRGRNSR